MPSIILRASQQTRYCTKATVTLKLNKRGKYQAKVLNGKVLPEYIVPKSTLCDTQQQKSHDRLTFFFIVE